MVGALITWPCMPSRVKCRSQPRQRNADAKKIPIMFHAQSVLESWIDYLEKRKLKSLHLSPVLTYDFLSRCKFSTPTINSTPLYNSNNRLFAQNPVFKIVLDKSVKVYLHIHVQRECSAGPSMRRILCDSGISHLSPVLANAL